MKVAIIPARGGSKRIPGKNIKPFLGRPIISYSIEAAIKSRLFDKVVVSTDSDEIASIAIKYGAEVPFMRPANLADDLTATAPVLENVIHLLEDAGDNISEFCCIYPTAPFINVKYLNKGYKILKEKNCTTAFSVTTFDFTIYRAIELDVYGRVKMINPENEIARSQDLPEAYHDAGQFYWFNKNKFMENPTLLPVDCYPVFIPRRMAQDIDSMEDWIIAECMYKCQKYRDKNEKSISRKY